MYIRPASLEKSSFNKKGGGTFLSKVERKIYDPQQNPGPGKYSASANTTATSLSSTNEISKRRKSAAKPAK